MQSPSAYTRFRTRLSRASLEFRAFAVAKRAGLVGFDRPSRIRELTAAMRDYGAFGATSRIAAIKHGPFTAIADERGELTYDEFEEQVNRLANAFLARLSPGDTIGLLCRNHRWLLITAFAATRSGFNLVWLNTGFAGPQLREVTEREGVDFLVHDASLADVVAEASAPKGKVACDITQAEDELDALAATGEPSLPPPPAKMARMIVLTSGTTGTPKGRQSAEVKGLVLPAGMLERLPMRPHQAAIIGPPLFHGTGLAIAMLTIALGGKLVLRSKFDPAQALDDMAKHGVTTLCVVPIMLQRMLALGDDEIRGRDLSQLQIIFCAGAQLPAGVATRALDVFGDVLHVLYGSTEASAVSIATPADLRVESGCVGRPVLGTRVRLLGDDGKAVPAGQIGRIFVAGPIPFDGYTDGSGKEVIDGFMSTGDVGRIDSGGRLHIEGRDDDMIVSGGENVFPGEVEEVLVTHPAVIEAATIGVDDEEFGKRLRAFVVLEPGSAVTPEDIKSFVKSNLARYKVPRDVVLLDELPRNLTGKVLKRALAAWEPADAER